MHTYFIFPHFKLLQGGDPLLDDKPGFQARMIGVRYFIMSDDLQTILTSYRTLDSFDDFQRYNETELNNEEKVCQHQKVQEMARIMLTYIDKHFSRWLNEHLLKLILFSEQPTAQVVANYLLGNASAPPSSFFSKLHQREIDLSKFATFLSGKCVTRPAILATNFVSNNNQIIQLIAQGMDLWQNDNLPEILHSFQQLYILRFASLMTTTHGTKRAVKTANHCTLPGRGDDTRSLYATTNHTSRDMKKVKAMYVPTKCKRSSDVNEKDL